MNVHGFSERVIDLAERLSDMADAAEGKGRRRSSAPSRWLVLPAAGAGIYALVRSDFFSKQAKGVATEAKSLVSELPSDLMSGVRQASQRSTTASSGTARKSSSPRRKSASRGGGQRRRPTRTRTRAKSAG